MNDDQNEKNVARMDSPSDTEDARTAAEDTVLSASVSPEQAHNERSPKALRGCAEWLAYCLRIGWPQSTLDALEAIWWTYHDSRGRLINCRQ